MRRLDVQHEIKKKSAEEEGRLDLKTIWRVTLLAYICVAAITNNMQPNVDPNTKK